MGDLTSGFQSGEEEEVRVVCECNVILSITLEDTKLDDWWWVYRAAIRRCYCRSVNGILRGTESSLHLAPDPQALARSGCWMTSSSYVRCRPSLVMRFVDVFVSFETASMLDMAGVC